MYRDELDAMNAMYQEQQKTNELLEKLVSVMKQSTVEKENVVHQEQIKTNALLKDLITTLTESNPEKEVVSRASKGRSGGNSGKGS